MLPGRYRRQSIDISQYKVNEFIPAADTGWGGCGATAISLLTGIRVNRLERGHTGIHFSDQWMVTQLRKRGYTTVPLRWKEFNSDHLIYYPITPNHVLLVSQLMFKREASWLVYYNGDAYHNFQKLTMHPYDLLNKPILTAYIVWHPKWGQLVY